MTRRPGTSASGIDFNFPPPNPPVPPARCHITRYPVNLTPTPSELCPHCAAPDRIKLWLPHLTSIAAHGPDIPQEARERVHTVTLHAWTASTRTAYGTGLLVYHTFCSVHEIPEEDRAPAKATLIARFISALAGQYAGQTIQGYVYGLRAWHVLNSLPWSPNEAQVAAMLKGATKLAPPTSKQDLRQPVTPQIITDIRAHVSDSPLDTAFYACLTTIFYAAARVGEFTVHQCDAFDPAENITPANVRVDVDRNNLRTTVFTLPRTKSSASGEEVQWAKQDGPTEPQSALDAHMALNEPPLTGPLFAYKDGSKHKPLMKTTFLKLLKVKARAAGYNSVQGHGIRIGTTLEYLLRGIPFEVMKTKGRWASDAFQLYLLRHNQILAHYIQAMSTDIAIEFTRLTMPRAR